ncbi:transposable element Tcb1 transposase [Trichonephila clavipes]|nr:transposable element Tcb1 transposase [Trichonephila clavipes]
MPCWISTAPITSSREERHVTRMALIHRAAPSRALSQESGSYHQDGRICVRWHGSERKLVVCIHHRHTDPSPGMMVWGVIGCMSGLPFARIDVSLNSARHISDTENVQLLPWLARSPDLSSIGNVRAMVAERLTRRYTPVTTLDELWYRVAIQFLFHSMPRCISAIITARGGWFGY